MKAWAQAELDELVSCSKKVVDPPRKEMRSEGGHQRKDMTLSSMDGKWRFSVFMRVNEKFPENFSIGLVHDPRNEPGELVLLRCNGPHGEHDNSPFEDSHPHLGYHIHRARADVIDSGLSPEKFAALTDAYASFQEALHHFLTLANIVDAEGYFLGCQQELFTPEEGQP
ncbi:MAG: hypothetical protein WCH07_11485 [Deltaproteobacteria bacterium]